LLRSTFLYIIDTITVCVWQTKAIQIPPKVTKKSTFPHTLSEEMESKKLYGL